MKLDRFDLNLLVVFATVYAEGNLTRAAQQLNVAQPTVSNAMTRLRAAFDDPLFVRSGRGVAPTPMAIRMIGPVRQTLRQMQAILDGNITFDPAVSDRTFHVSMGELEAAALLPVLIEKLGVEAPRARLRSFQADRREIREKLALGVLDLAIDIPRLSSYALNRHPLRWGDYVCALRQGHPRARGPLTLDRFLELQFISVSSRPTGSSLLELMVQRAGGHVEPVLRSQHYLPALGIVGSSDYALVAPRGLALQWGLLAKELPFALDREDFCLYWHRSAEDDPASQWLRALVIRCWSTLEPASN